MVRLTDRDNEIFEFLFKFRYVTPTQLSNYLNCSVKSVYDRVEKLVKDRYVESTNVAYINKRLYSNGVEIRKAHPIKAYRRKIKINSWSIVHHLGVIDIYMYFIQKYKILESDITSEREMYWKKTGILDKKQIFKMPDLVIKKDEELIAIEFEKSMKNRNQLSDVFTNYSLYTSYYCVRYICETKGIKERVIRVAEEENKPFIQAYTADEFFNGIDVIGF